MPLILGAHTHYVEAPLVPRPFSGLLGRFIENSGESFHEPFDGGRQGKDLCFGSYDLHPEGMRPLLERAFPRSSFHSNDLDKRERFIATILAVSETWDNLFPGGDVHFIFRLNQVKDTTYATYHRETVPLTGAWNIMGKGTRVVLDGIDEERFKNSTYEDAESFAREGHTSRVLEVGSFCLFDDELMHAAPKPTENDLSWRAIALWELAEGALLSCGQSEWKRAFEELARTLAQLGAPS